MRANDFHRTCSFELGARQWDRGARLSETWILNVGCAGRPLDGGRVEARRHVGCDGHVHDSRLSPPEGARASHAAGAASIETLPAGSVGAYAVERANPAHRVFGIDRAAPRAVAAGGWA